MKRRERPHLVFAPNGNSTRVLALANGVLPVDGAGEYGDRSFTLVQVRKIPRPFDRTETRQAS